MNFFLNHVCDQLRSFYIDYYFWGAAYKAIIK